MSEIDLVNEGVELYNNQQFEDSLKKLEEAISVNPKCKEAYFNKGLCHQSLNDNAKALECFDQALNLDPNYTSAIIGKGNSHLRQGDREQALSFFEQALSIKENLPLAKSGKSLCLYELGKKDEVNEIIDKQIEENTDDYIPYLIKGNILKEENKLEDTIEQYKNCIKYNKNCYEAFYNMALCQAELNQNDEALTNMEETLKLNSDLPQAIDAKGCILYSNKNVDEAIKCYNELIEKDKDKEVQNADYFFKKGSTERELKLYEDAIKSFDEALKINPELVKAILLKGSCYDYLNKNDWALENYEKVIQKDGDNELAHQLK